MHVLKANHQTQLLLQSLWCDLVELLVWCLSPGLRPGPRRVGGGIVTLMAISFGTGLALRNTGTDRGPDRRLPD
jgi:hypothetical protein